MSILTIKKLATGYRHVTVSQDLNYSFQEGKITSIIGPNGCGKSTLLKTLARLLSPQQGVVLLNEKKLTHYSTTEVAKEIAILAQFGDRQVNLSVYDLVSFWRYPYQKGWKKLTKKDKEHIEWALHITQLTSLALQAVSDLSGGQRQRVWIALALVQDTDILILDEPTTYLDPAHQLEVLNVLRGINQAHDKTIIMTLHDINLASRFSDRILAMKQGEIIKEGSAEEVITREILKKIYGIDAEIVCHQKTQRPLMVAYDNLSEEDHRDLEK